MSPQPYTLPDDSVPLPRSAGEIAELTGGKAPPYRAIYQGIVDGQIPAQKINGIYHLRRETLPDIARRFGLKLSEKAEARGRSRTFAE